MYKDFTVLQIRDFDELVPLIRRYMYAGWMPFGPILLDRKHYLQAMIRLGA